jgi:divalent metal cation (Fe/Co/Zn/Cd) transporter
LLVSLLILHQGLSLIISSFGELTDASASHKIVESLYVSLTNKLIPATHRSNSLLLGISSVRAVRRGRHLFVDVTVDVDAGHNHSLASALELEDKIVNTVKESRKDAFEVRVQFRKGGGA